MEKNKCGFSVFVQNPSVWNEFFVWNCLELGNIDKFKQMLKEEMPLSAPMLSIMLYWGYNREAIKEVLKIAEIIDDSIFPWMQEFFEVDELAEILPEYDELLPKDYPSNEDCVRLKLWKALLKRRRYDDVAQNAPEVLEENEYLTHDVCQALLRANFVKYADICFKKGLYSEILAVKDGWKYLIEHGKMTWLYAWKHLPSFISKEDMIAYCLENGMYQALYEVEMYDLLLEHGQVDVFVKNKSGYRGFLDKYPEKVDWEYRWKCSTEEDGRKTFLTEEIRKKLLKVARQHKDVPACVEFLKNHGTWWDKMWL